MNSPDEHLKMRCRNHHTSFHYDETGISWKCRYCRIVENVSWERLNELRREAEVKGTSTTKSCMV
jgi:hypothetical protein